MTINDINKTEDPKTVTTCVIVLKDKENLLVVDKGKARQKIQFPEYKLPNKDCYEALCNEYKKEIGCNIVNLMFKGEVIIEQNRRGERERKLIFMGTEFYGKPFSRSVMGAPMWIDKKRLPRYRLGPATESILKCIKHPLIDYGADLTLCDQNALSVIRNIRRNDLLDLEMVIKCSFKTVSDTYAFTKEDFPNFAGFIVNQDVLEHMFNEPSNKMYGYFDNERLLGCVTLTLRKNLVPEINLLCVLPDYRHMKIGESLLNFAIEQAFLNCQDEVNAEIMYENTILKNWFINHSFELICMQKPSDYPFTLACMNHHINKQK